MMNLLYEKINYRNLETKEYDNLTIHYEVTNKLNFHFICYFSCGH